MIHIDQLKTCEVQTLPSSVQELVRVIGLTAALKLVEHYGGTSFIVPQGLRRDGQAAYEAIAEIIGYKEMAAFAAHYRGDDVLYIPCCKAALRAVRNRLIRADFDAYTIEESATRAVMKLARAHQMSDRWVWEIVNSAETTAAFQPEQVALFA